MKFENGAVGKTASVIDALQPYLLNVHLVGAKGSIWNDKFFTTELGGLNKERWSRVETPMLGSGDVGNHPYRELFEDFIRSLEMGQKPLFSFEDAIFSHRVCLAADLSASENRPVSLEEMA
jgi:predicted dehydrogenase